MALSIWSYPKQAAAVARLRPLTPALALTSEAGGKVSDHKSRTCRVGWQSPLEVSGPHSKPGSV